MKLVLDKKHENRVEFLVDGISLPFANMLRRYAISSIPVLAVDSVVFYDNNSAFWDEYLAHRLGLMPIITPEKLPESTEIVFTLDAEGPKIVYASDMKSSDKEISIAKDKLPFVTLGPNQHVRLEAKAILGTAKQHAKFQAGIVSYGEDGKGLRFTVESFFQMTPTDVLQRTCDVIESDINDVEAALGETKPVKKSKKKKTEETVEPKKEENVEEEEKLKKTEAKEKSKKKK
ncbi:DNA-directed RNA polymerase subunit D [Candidatus Micrarchaeota archaeon]|nr:DNA-directed RNA polymerase subunit D [Candidatus Micrarchaeota archaeon]